jgi:hypothetical protein
MLSRLSSLSAEDETTASEEGGGGNSACLEALVHPSGLVFLPNIDYEVRGRTVEASSTL